MTGRRIRPWNLAAAVIVAGTMLAPPALAHDPDGQQVALNDEETPNDASSLASSPKVSKAVTETEIVAGRDERPMLSLGSAYAMQDAVARYEIIVAGGGWPTVRTARLKVGEAMRDAVPLKRRLAAEGFYPAEHADNPLVTGNTLQALRQFQINYGLAANGKLDKATLAALNVPAEQRLATLRANLARLAEYGKDLGPRYIIVNIPSLQLEAVNGIEVFSRHNIIVGKPDRPSPVVMTELSDINFNPYWNAPVSIVERDIIPEVRRKGPGVLRQMGIRIFDGYSGPEVDPDTVDWDTVAPSRYFFRQDPGEANAMAAVKINFPSPFGVYMHDTPTRNLFTTGARYLSSGCVRVDKVDILVNWILDGQDGWDAARIEEMALTGERLDVKLLDPPQIRWVYLTAWTSGDGRVNFRNDIYDLDGTGFIIGQPTPVGEYADDGLRFFLAAPVKQAAVDPAVEDMPETAKDPPAAQEPDAEPPVAKKSLRKLLTRKPNFGAKSVLETDGGATRAKTEATDLEDARPKPKTNFNRPAETKKLAAKAKSVAATAKAAVVPKAKPALEKRKAAGPVAADTAKPAKKKKPLPATASVSVAPVFGPQ